MLSYFPYIKTPGFSGVLKKDVKNLFYANDKPKTFTHVMATAFTCVKIAEQYNLEPDICEISGYLHDISAVIPPSDMMTYAVENKWRIDEAEKKYPVLLHQRISKVIAKEDFGITDERILFAIECHSTLKANPSDYDMALFVADKLAWQDSYNVPVTKALFYDIVSDALKQSLEAACLAYMDYIVEHKMILHPHKWYKESVRFLRSKVLI